MLARIALLIAVAGCLAAPAGLAATGRTDRRDCPAAGLSKRLAPQPGLPPAVAHMRQTIASAAIDCDYARLGALAHSKYGFRVGFHEAMKLEAYLRNEPKLMKELVVLLNEPYTTGRAVDERTQEETNTRVFFWPKAELPPDRFFYGYFVTITEDGEWSAYGNAD